MHASSLGLIVNDGFSSLETLCTKPSLLTQLGKKHFKLKDDFRELKQ